MGQQWDGGDVAFRPETWAAVWRVLKPGAHLVAFSGTRTYHRMACAIEDAGFEIRDQLAWIYGSGFPKSHNQPGGWGTALKPAWEPICLARKPLQGTVAGNIASHGTGAINIDGCRIEHGDEVDLEHVQRQQAGPVSGFRMAGSKHGKEVPMYKPGGRWPANIIHDGSEEVLAGFPETESGTGAIKRSSAAENVGNQGAGLWSRESARWHADD
jgi:site-specific DNA-methyltransferase (adenine-specific)